MLILQTLLVGPVHGQTIAHTIQRESEDVLQVEHQPLATLLEQPCVVRLN